MAGPNPWPKVSFAPVVELLNNNDRIIGRQLGVHRTTIAKWRRLGLPEERADEVAVKLGCHPCELWPEWWDEQ